jgi:hypothetical protein
MILVALSLAIAAGLVYAVIAALVRGDRRSAIYMAVLLVLAGCLASLMLRQLFLYGF